MTEPHNLPAPGPPWGSRSMAVDLAGHEVEVRGLTAAQAADIERSYETRRHRGGSHAFSRLSIERGSTPTMTPGRFAVGGIYTPEAGHGAKHVELAGLGFAGSIDLKGSSGRLVTSDEALTTQPIVFQNYLRVFSAYQALVRGGLLLHCSAIARDGRAHLFLGRSGAGKTTLARSALAAGAEVLSDDIALVVPRARGGYEAAYVPFSGELGPTCTDRGRRYEIASLSWLVKSDRLSVAPLTLASQCSRALACCPYVNEDRFRFDQAFSSVEALVAASPMRELRLRRGEAFDRVVAELEVFCED